MSRRQLENLEQLCGVRIQDHTEADEVRAQWQDWLDRLALERLSDEQPDGTSRGVDWSEA